MPVLDLNKYAEKSSKGYSATSLISNSNQWCTVQQQMKAQKKIKEKKHINYS